METSEINAIRKCQEGELDEFGFLYDKYVRKIYDFIYYKTNHKETAEDLTSQTFFKALNSLNSFKIEQNHFSAWLYKIARNVVIDHYRTRKNHENLDDFQNISSSEKTEENLDNARQLEKIQRYLKNFNEEQRDIIILRVWQEMSYKEIAETLQKSEASCKMQFSRAIKKLREEMPLELLLLILLKF